MKLVKGKKRSQKLAVGVPGCTTQPRARCGRAGKPELRCAALPVRAGECRARQRVRHGVWRQEGAKASAEQLRMVWW